jgi:endoglucanase
MWGGKQRGSQNRGIEIGDPIVFHPNFQKIGKDIILTKAIDNRVGCAILIDLAERMKGKKIEYQLFLLAAAQEEIGSRGAKVALDPWRIWRW